MNASISVVIPAYNVESYVGECLDSLLNQSIPNLQIICVNDGSTDQTADILDKYARNFSSICVVSQENSGQSVARNKGLGCAKGSYVMFCDADDKLANGALKKIVDRAEETMADVVYFDAESFFESEGLRQSHESYSSYYCRQGSYDEPRSGIRLIADMSSNGEWRPSAPLQFYRSQFLRDSRILFIPGIIHEDNAFTYCIALKARITTHIREALYLRRVRPHSTMTTDTSSDNVIGLFKCFLTMMQASAEQGINDSAVLEVPYSVLMQARSIYSSLSAEEQTTSMEAFADKERIAFWTLLSKDSALLDDAINTRCELESIKGSRRYALAERLASIRNALP